MVGPRGWLRVAQSLVGGQSLTAYPRGVHQFADYIKLGGVAGIPEDLADTSEGPQQAGEMGQQEPHEVPHEGEVQSPAPGQEQPQVPFYTDGHPDGKHPGRKGPGGPAGHQVEHKPAMGPCS